MLSIRMMYGIPIASTLAAGAFGLMLVSCGRAEANPPIDAVPQDRQVAAPEIKDQGGYVEGIEMQHFASPDGSTLCELDETGVSCYSRMYRAAVTCFQTGCNRFQLQPTDVVGTFPIRRVGDQIGFRDRYMCTIEDDDRVNCIGYGQHMIYEAGRVRIS